MEKPFIQAPRAALLTFIERASHCAAQKTNLPALGMTALWLKGDDLHGASTNIDNAFSTKITCDNSGGNFEILINGELLRRRIDVMPVGDIRLEIVNGTSRMRVTSLTSPRRFELIGMPFWEAKEIPSPPTTGRVQMLASDFRRLLGSVKHAVSTDATKIVSSALFGWKKDRLVSVGTDGHRLMFSSTNKCQEEWSFPDALIRQESMPNLLRVLEWAEKVGGADVLVDVVVGETMFVTTNVGTYSTKLSTSGYVSYENLLEGAKGGNRVRTTANRAALTNALRAVGMVAADEGGVEVTVGDGLLKLEAKSPTTGEATDELPCDYFGTPVGVRLQQKYLVDLLETLTSNDVMLSIGDRLDVVFVAPYPTNESMEHTALIMPMNIGTK